MAERQIREWHKALTATRWTTLLSADWELTIARSPSGIWRVTNSPYSGGFSQRLTCDDDLGAAQTASLELVAAMARSRIESDQAILAAVEVSDG